MRTLATIILLLACSASCPAQSPTDDRAALERYLEDHGLDRLLIEHLRREIDVGDQARTAQAAPKLAAIYSRLLERSEGETNTPLLDEATAFADAHPQHIGDGLRLALATARFRTLETDAERWRLGLLPSERREPAASALLAVGERLTVLATRLRTEVSELEQRARAARVRDYDAGIDDEMEAARRRLSAARYYAGWALYHHAAMSDFAGSAHRSIEQFAFLLDLGGEQPSTDRLPKSLLRYDHVARSALGIALCEAQLGETDLALNWIDTLLQSELVSPAVTLQAHARAMELALRAERWGAGHEHLIALGQQSGGAAPTADARLAALLAMEALRTELTDRARADAAAVAELAMGDLVTRGEIAQVVDLLDRFGDAPGLGEGFVARYVQGIRAYESARRAQADAGEPAGTPSNTPHIVTLYSTASERLARALAAHDGNRLPRERIACRVLMARCLLASGQPVKAAEQFRQASRASSDPQQAEDALWMAIVSYDTAAAGGNENAAADRDTLAAEYLRGSPRPDRAGALVLRMLGADGVAPDRAIELLRAVPADAPVHATAQRELCTLLFSRARAAPAPERARLAQEFFQLAESLNRDAIESADDDAMAAVALRLRQTAELALMLNPPEPDRAAAAVERLRSLAASGRVTLNGLEAELEYRMLRVALLRNDPDAADRSLDALRARGGTFAEAGVRQAFADAAARWWADQSNLALAERVFRLGRRVLEQEQPDTPWAESVRSRTAESARALWSAREDTAARDEAIRLDRRSIELGTASEATYRRLARLAEQAGDVPGATDAWVRLMRALPQGDPGWFEARHESIRLLLAHDPDRARDAMEQLITLYPSLGPEPWAARFRQYATQLGLKIPEPAP